MEHNTGNEDDGELMLELKQQQLKHERESIQKDRFTEWINEWLHYGNSSTIVNDIYHDLSDGLILAELLNILTNGQFKIKCDRVKFKVGHILNVESCLRYLRTNCNGFSDQDAVGIVEHKPIPILRLIWSMIIYFGTSPDHSTWKDIRNDEEKKLPDSLQQQQQHDQVVVLDNNNNKDSNDYVEIERTISFTEDDDHDRYQHSLNSHDEASDQTDAEIFEQWVRLENIDIEYLEQHNRKIDEHDKNDDLVKLIDFIEEQNEHVPENLSKENKNEEQLSQENQEPNAESAFQSENNHQEIQEEIFFERKRDLHELNNQFRNDDKSDNITQKLLVNEDRILLTVIMIEIILLIVHKLFLLIGF